MKRVLCLISSVNAGGAETFLMKIYRELDKGRFQMDFCINTIDKCFYEDEIMYSSYNLKVNDTYEEYEILKIKKNESSFNELLFKYIEISNISEVELYKKAYIDRRLFSKIRSYNEYHPSFGTVTLLALALNLSSNDYEKLLKSASYSLPLNSYINITLKYCFDEKMYNVNMVNDLLYAISGKQIKEL